MNDFPNIQRKKLRPRCLCHTLGSEHRAPQPQSHTSSKSSTDARRICLHLCTSTLWNCFCSARISAHSVAVWGNLLWGGAGPEWGAGLARPAQVPSPLGPPTHPLASARLCQDSKVWAVLSRDQRR